MRQQIELSNEAAAELAGSQRRGPARARGPRRLRRVPARQRRHARRRRRRPSRPRRPSCASSPTLIEQGHEIAPGTIAAVTGALDQHASPARDPRGRRLAPPLDAGRAEDRQPEALRRLDPRATPSRSASARPAPARRSSPSRWPPPRCSRREVNRIILTRPAVEAGERLGFLPGDLMAKIDPYLRPLFDALHDMLDAEKRRRRYLERGQIEVAPLAFMRGRAQPVDQPVLTPTGWQAIGSLRVGRPRRRLRRPADAGARASSRRAARRSSACRRRTARRRCACAEHLWSVTTPDDRTRGKAGRVAADATR